MLECALGISPSPDARMLDRRRLLMGSVGIALADFLRCRALAARKAAARADACILFFLNGGMSHLDTVDPKPDQPAEIRGEFKAVSTRVPGIRFTEHLPRLAEQAHRLAILRSVGFDGKLGNHSPGCYYVMTGIEPQGEAAVLAPPLASDHPTPGSVAAMRRPSPGGLPSFVMVPDVLIENAHLTPGQFAGVLGNRFQPFRLRADPSLPGFKVDGLSIGPEMSAERLGDRRRLLGMLDGPGPRTLDSFMEQAFDLLQQGKARKAFDIEAEPARIREAYGRNVIGQSLLLARRLVEAGVRFVNVHWPNVGGGRNWDTHSNGFTRLKRDLLPPTDRGLAALVNDLAERGMLKKTLVIVLTEFGRAPQIGRTFQNSGGPGGRDHWSNCYSVIMAGGGIRGGITYGSSDAKGAYPAEQPLVPGDVIATLYEALGIDPGLHLHEAEGKVRILSDRKGIAELF